MAVEGSRVKLSQHEDLVDATVYAITHRDVYHPIASTHWNLHKTKKTFNFLMSKKKKELMRLTAGVAARLVRGKSLAPLPPPRMIAATFLGSAFFLSNSEGFILCKQTKQKQSIFKGIL